MNEKDKQEIKLWICQDCGFGFDEVHENDDGSGYSCPVCEVSNLEKKLDERDKEVERLKQECTNYIELASTWQEGSISQHKENQRLRKALEDIINHKEVYGYKPTNFRCAEIARKALAGEEIE